MLAEAAAYSKERSRGVISSQPASRRARTGRETGGALKSGARNGFASCRATTVFGTTRRTADSGAASGSGAGGSSGASIPAAVIISRRSVVAASDRTASSASSWSRRGSRAAVFARIVATPSSRRSCSARYASVADWSVLTRLRSSRTSRATTWNLVRIDGLIAARSTAPSTSRTALARTGIRPSASLAGRRRRLPAAPPLEPPFEALRAPEVCFRASPDCRRVSPASRRVSPDCRRPEPLAAPDWR